MKGGAGNISYFLETFLENTVPEINAHPDADSAFFWDANYVEIQFKGFELQTDDEGRPRLYPVQVQDDVLSIETKVIIQATASCEFALSLIDSIDKDNVSMGGASKTIDFEFETELLFTVVGDLKGDIDNIEVDSVEMLSSPRSIDFGTLEPDWWHEDRE